MSKVRTRLVAYDGNTFKGILPQASTVKFANPLNDTSAVEVTYSKLTQGGDLLYSLFGNDWDLAVEISIGDDAWFEPRNARFVVADDDVDWSDPNQMVRIVGMNSVCYDATGIVNANGQYLSGDDAVWQFTSASPGHILFSYLAHAKSLGMGTSVSLSFTSSTDSNGVAWPQAVTLGVKPETTFMQLLEAFAEQGLIDFDTQGNTLNCYIADGFLARERDTELVYGREIVKGPTLRTKRERVDQVLILGDEGAKWTRQSSNPNLPRGRRGAVLAQGGVKDSGTAYVFADAALASGGISRAQMTRDLRMYSDSEETQRLNMPYRDYRVGDYIWAPGSSPQGLEHLRVRQITLDVDSTGLVDGSILLNDRFLEGEIRRNRKLSGLTGGATSPGGSGSAPTPPESGKRKPAKPAAAPTASSAAYVNDRGQPRAVVHFLYPAVGSGEDGQPINVHHYEVAKRRSSSLV